MARAQSPDSGDSQFFICFEDSPWLNGQYTVWGQVVEGMDNVDKIKRGEPVTNQDRIVSARMAGAARPSFASVFSRRLCPTCPGLIRSRLALLHLSVRRPAAIHRTPRHRRPRPP